MKIRLFYSKFANTLYCILHMNESGKAKGRKYRMCFAKQDVRTALIICRAKSDVGATTTVSVTILKYISISIMYNVFQPGCGE